MENRIPIKELVSKVLSELERLNYAYNTICGYRAFYKRVISFAKTRDEIYFSEALGRDFLKETYNCTVNYYQEAMPKGLKGPIRRIRVLGDNQLHGVIIRRIVKSQDMLNRHSLNPNLLPMKRIAKITSTPKEVYVHVCSVCSFS